MNKEELILRAALAGLSQMTAQFQKISGLVETYARMRDGEEVPEDVVISKIDEARKTGAALEAKLKAIAEGN